MAAVILRAWFATAGAHTHEIIGQAIGSQSSHRLNVRPLELLASIVPTGHAKYGTLRNYGNASARSGSGNRIRFVVQSAERVSLVGVECGLAWLDVRHHGPTDFRAGARSGDALAVAGGDGGRGSNTLQRHSHGDFHGGMGSGRSVLRHPGRSLGPRQDHDADYPVLLLLHGSVGALDFLGGLHVLPLPHRTGCGR